ncbi:hypothetical protein I3760_13G121900 [Carya illinoinensis]|uniref:Uncharacterized protein n=1 Tax=Carya illinoinensis TaxID=32201 RepID=A0A8T1NQG4_CARIL|nr:E3 ubiquitin-protein ligase RZFP34 [Carya illinoinensis]KAG2674152.1 hypothetical protein I3760_13G121900 [Carya illinoinensis]KAG6631931.1 hypothetical protein CIPAW_13G123000 [Carya illinoinensis]KAG6682102.1 hypothetical protein I3842_13G121500 [Carya illinoinensis]
MESETEASLSSQSSAISELSDEDVSVLENGSGNYGCSHYRRRCKIRAPCCNEIFDCRHCHNEAKNSIETDPLDQHDLPRHEVEQVICSLCGTEQDVQQYCTSCGVCMGKYFCTTCKFFDDDTSKNQFHCDECGICRIGGKENFFHCNKCECCYSKSMEDGHQCVERAMHHNCPVCFEFLFDSMKAITVLPCGHTIHDECMEEMMQHFRYSCPICSKSIGDMSGAWAKLDEVIASTPMPEIYLNKMVWILCNDCGANSNVQFHVMAHKCPSCKSYNTRQIQGEQTAPCASRVAETMSCHTG